MFDKRERFIAQRLSGAKEARRDARVTRVATASVAICICVILVTVFVVRGFQNTISEKVAGLLSHVEIVNFANRYSEDTVPLEKEPPYLDEVKANRYVKAVYPYSLKWGMIRTAEDVQGALVRGFDGEYDASFMEQFVVEGRMPDMAAAEKKREALISEKTARAMGLKLGDAFEMLFTGEKPMRDRFVIAGIYRTSFGEFDERNIITDIRNVQRLNGWSGEEVSGLGVTLNKLGDLDRAERELARITNDEKHGGQQATVVGIKDRYGDIFEWLELQNVNERVVLVIMMVVAAFNMITMMLILILRKTSMIGVFKALGMRDGAIRRIFILRLSRVIGIGMLWGNAVALAISWVQIRFGILKLNAEGYLLDTIPVEIDVVALIAVNVCVFAILTTLQLIPTMLIARLAPYKSLKYE